MQGFSGTSEVIYVYLEEEFAWELRTCNNYASPQTADESLHITDVEEFIQRSMHQWNTQAKGAAFKYAGTADAEDAEEAAGSGLLPQRPAVFLRFSPNSSGSSRALATAQEVSSIADVTQISFWGNDNGVEYGNDAPYMCYYTPDEDNINWLFGSQYDDYAGGPSLSTANNVVGVLNHELGHILGLGHAYLSSDFPIGSAVMGNPADIACYFDSSCADTPCLDNECLCGTGDQWCADAHTISCTRDSNCPSGDFCAPYTGSNCFDSNGDPLDDLDSTICTIGYQKCENDQASVKTVRKLFLYDRICSSQVSVTRYMKYAKMAWKNRSSHFTLPETYPTTVSSSIPQTKWGLGGGSGAWEFPSGYFKYPILRRTGGTTTSYNASVYSDGYLNFYGTTLGVPASLFDHYAPTVQRLRGTSGADAQLLVPNMGPTYASEEHPTPVQVASYDNATSSWTVDELERCNGNIYGCGTTSPVHTSRFIATTYDPQSGLDVSAVIGIDGDIQLLVGYLTPSRFHIQTNLQQQTTKWLLDPAQPTQVPSPEGRPDWRYTGKTTGRVGLACGEVSELGFPHNCILAWTDIGAPTGQILYTYFKVVESSHGLTVSKGIEWYTASDWFWVLELKPDISAVNGVSAAYFNNALHLAWLPADGTETLKYIWNSTNSFSWDQKTLNSFSTPNIVSSPTFLAQDGRESALVWSIR